MKSIELRKNIISALLLTTGLILNILVPPIFFGMKFDFMLTFIFLAILVHPTRMGTYIVGIVGGFLEGMITTFPGGQLPNFLNVIITVSVLYVIIRILKNRVHSIVLAGICGFIGTLVSGASFLFIAMLIVGLPASFTSLFVIVVVPTVLVNLFLTPFLYLIFEKSLALTNNKLYESR